MLFDTLKDLCMIDGPSGFEQEVAREICRRLDGKCQYTIDNLGNILAFKKGKETPKNKLMISAHMDEVGMIVTGALPDGMLRIGMVGGIDPRVVLGRPVTVGPKKIKGVLGTKAMHMQTKEERSTAVPADKLYIDIGAKDKEDALSIVSLGDPVSFCASYQEFGEGFICSKAIDDRFGCAVLLTMIESELSYDTHFAFCVQEEVGLRGARAAAFTIAPDVAIVVETTTAADISGVEEHKQVCKLGDGPAVSFMDNATVYDRELYALAFDVARKNGIPCQTKTLVAGGNDAGAIHVSRGGVRTIAVSIPGRYLHSPSTVASKRDMEAAARLVPLLAAEAANL